MTAAGKGLLGMFGTREPSVLGVEVSASSIKVVQLKKKHGQAVLETYGELALGPYEGVEEGKATNLPTDKVAEAFRDLLNVAKVTSRTCGASIPLRSSLITIIEMPDLGERKLAEMIPIEVRKYIPVNISEVMLDWKIIPRPGVDVGGSEDDKGQPKRVQGNVEVLVVAIHRETISRYQAILSGAGLTPTFFEIEVFSTIRSSIDSSSTPTMVFDFGSANTKLLIVEHGILRQSHIINRGSQDMTVALAKTLGITPAEAERIKKTSGIAAGNDNAKARETLMVVIGGIFAEANRVILSYQEKYHANIGTVVLTGGGALLAGLEEVAKEALRVTVKRANPFGKIETPAFLEPTLRAVGPEFAVAIGTALRKIDESD